MKSNTLPVFRTEGEPFLNGLPGSLCDILSQISNLGLQVEFRSLGCVPVLDSDAQGLVPPPCQNNDAGQERRYYVEDSIHNTQVQMSLQVDDLVFCIETGASLRALNLSVEVDRILEYTSECPSGSTLGQCLQRIGDMHGLIKDVHVEGDHSLAAKFRQFQVTGDKESLWKPLFNDTMLIDFTLQGYEWDEEPAQDWEPAELEHGTAKFWSPDLSESSESYDYEYRDIDDEESCESHYEILELQNKEREAVDSQRHDNTHVWNTRDKLAQIGFFVPNSVFNNSPGTLHERMFVRMINFEAERSCIGSDVKPTYALVFQSNGLLIVMPQIGSIRSVSKWCLNACASGGATLVVHLSSFVHVIGT